MTRGYSSGIGLTAIPTSSCTNVCSTMVARKDMAMSVEAAIATTDAFLSTFNAGDAPGHAATLAYPHVRLASGRVRIWESIEEAIPVMEQGIAALRDRVGWDHSRWDYRRVIHTGPGKVHLDVQFTRYRVDDSVI